MAPHWIPAPQLPEDKLRGNDSHAGFHVIPAQAGIGDTRASHWDDYPEEGLNTSLPGHLQ